MRYNIRLATLSGSFNIAESRVARDAAEALAIVRSYCEPRGFTDLKQVDDGEDPGFYRITARTPGGRSGRNVAFIDIVDWE